MTRDKIKNKTQLEIINVNKTITNKRRGIESKEEIKWRTAMNFFIASTQFEKERKVIWSQITLNHDTRSTRKEKGCQDESNDAAESRL